LLSPLRELFVILCDAKHDSLGVSVFHLHGNRARPSAETADTSVFIALSVFIAHYPR
jgi:hypothetical protein